MLAGKKKGSPEHTLVSASNLRYSNCLGTMWVSRWHSFLCSHACITPDLPQQWVGHSTWEWASRCMVCSQLSPCLWEQGKGAALLTHAIGTQAGWERWLHGYLHPAPTALTSSADELTQQAHRTATGYVPLYPVFPFVPFSSCPLAPDLHNGRAMSCRSPSDQQTHWPGSASMPCLKWTVATPWWTGTITARKEKQRAFQEKQVCKRWEGAIRMLPTYKKAAAKENWQRRVVPVEA